MLLVVLKIRNTQKGIKGVFRMKDRKTHGFDFNNELESLHYPKGIPIIVSSGIKAKRCEKCNTILFVNNLEFGLCRKCRNLTAKKIFMIFPFL